MQAVNPHRVKRIFADISVLSARKKSAALTGVTIRAYKKTAANLILPPISVSAWRIAAGFMRYSPNASSSAWALARIPAS